MRNERGVKDAVKRILADAGAWFVMPVQCGYGRRGIPDFLICHKGQFIAVETKFGNRTPTAYQAEELYQIKAHGGMVLVVNEKNLEELRHVLAGI